MYMVTGAWPVLAARGCHYTCEFNSEVQLQRPASEYLTGCIRQSEHHSSLPPCGGNEASVTCTAPPPTRLVGVYHSPLAGETRPMLPALPRYPPVWSEFITPPLRGSQNRQSLFWWGGR